MRMMGKRRSSLSILRRNIRICLEWDIKKLGMGMSMTRRKRMKMKARMRTISIKRMSSISRMHLACKSTIQEQDMLVLVEACLETNNSEVLIILLVTNSTSMATQLKNLRLLELLSLRMMLKAFQCLRCPFVAGSKVSLTLCLITGMTLCTLCKMLWMKRNSCLF
jgi:hypothetical protein